MLFLSKAVKIGTCEGPKVLKEHVTLSKLMRNSVVKGSRVKPEWLREEAPEQPGNLPQGALREDGAWLVLTMLLLWL
jgi:hypothetical protein